MLVDRDVFGWYEGGVGIMSPRSLRCINVGRSSFRHTIFFKPSTSFVARIWTFSSILVCFRKCRYHTGIDAHSWRGSCVWCVDVGDFGDDGEDVILVVTVFVVLSLSASSMSCSSLSGRELWQRRTAVPLYLGVLVIQCGLFSGGKMAHPMTIYAES